MDSTTPDASTHGMDSKENSTIPMPTDIEWIMGNASMEGEIKTIREVVPAVFAVLLVLGLVANCLVVYVTIVTKRSTNHPIHSIFVLNLAVSDVIFLVISGPYWMVVLTVSQWRFGSFLCAFFPFVTTASVCSAIYTICALAWIRFMALAMPFRFRRSCMSTRKAGYIMLLLIWICGCLLSMPYLFFYRLEGSDGVYNCDWAGSEQSKNIHSIVNLLTTYLIPLVLVIVFYSFVAREVLCYMMHRNTMLGQEQTKEKKECMKSTVVMLFLITAFLICWLPHLLGTVFSLTGYHNERQYWKGRLTLQVVGKATAYTHAIVNPIIYTFASPIFRHSLRLSLRNRMKSCRNPANRSKDKTHALGKDGKRNNETSYQDATKDTGLATTTRKIFKGEATTPNTDQVRMLTADSHATEITRLASPDLPHVRRNVQQSSETDNEHEPLNVQPDDTRI